MEFDVSVYWNDRYASGGTSGAGSYGRLAEFKSKFLNDFFERNSVKSVLDFGCGDGNQIESLHIDQYIGTDISHEAIAICQRKFREHEGRTFLHKHDLGSIRAQATLSLDVIYHLVDDNIYKEYMELLFSRSEQYVIIYSTNEESSSFTEPHVRHRRFTDWVEQDGNFSLTSVTENQFPPNDTDSSLSNTSPCSFFVFERETS